MSETTTSPAAATTGPSGTLRILTWFGIPVYLHWSWAVVAFFQLQWRSDAYGGSMLWIAAEYIGLFVLVLLHEFGHALACRSVGGTVSHVLLWPLGGVAHVRPPQRPGALLWSIVAGPLVNLVLGSMSAALWIGMVLIAPDFWPNFQYAVGAFTAINVALFVFNMLPIHPLDGGQIVRSLLWFVVGRELSLVLTSGVGLVAGVLGGLAAWFFLGSYWLPLIAAYAVWRSWKSLHAAIGMQRILSGPRRETLHCPSCGASPPMGNLWLCPNGHPFDLFERHGQCGSCDARVRATPCIVCMEVHAIPHFARTP